MPKLLELNIDLPENIAIEADILAYNEDMGISKCFGNIEIKNISQIIRIARAVKTDYELELIKESGIKHSALYSHIESIYKDGMTDEEISIELEYRSRKIGNLGMFRIFGSSMEIFMGSVIAGDNADSPSPYDFAMGGSGSNPTLPVGANGTILKPGMTLMIDLGGNFTGYMTDMTRTFIIHNLENELALDRKSVV